LGLHQVRIIYQDKPSIIFKINKELTKTPKEVKFWLFETGFVEARWTKELALESHPLTWGCSFLWLYF
jgi:hypothetical protein